ncbi:g4035 [Coccomyxa elongata]
MASKSIVTDYTSPILGVFSAQATGWADTTGDSLSGSRLLPAEAEADARSSAPKRKRWLSRNRSGSRRSCSVWTRRLRSSRQG